MNIIWLFFVILIQNTLNIDCVNDNDNKKEEYVTIWAPKKVYEQKNYNVAVLSNNIDRRTEIAFQFRKSFGTISLSSEKVQKVSIKNKNGSGSKTSFELMMTLHRNETTSTGTRAMCMSEKLLDIETEKRPFYTFIQTDKPIYKPGDHIRFRIVVVDRDLKPYHMNNIYINITDPFNRPIQIFDDLEDDFLGVFSRNFTLQSNTPLGIWKIRAVINKMEQWETFKEIAVQKYSLPLFNTYLSAKDNHILTNGIINLEYYAKYSFGEFVRGNAYLTITCTTTKNIVLTRNYTDVKGIQNIKFRANHDLNAKTITKLDYVAEIVFEEPESGTSANRSLNFAVHANSDPRIEANYPDNFMPGIPYSINVRVYDWQEKLIMKSIEMVKFSLICVLKNGEDITFSSDVRINKGNAVYNEIVQEDVVAMKVRIKFIRTVHEKQIERGSVIIGVNKILVNYTPQNPNIGDSVNIYVNADSNLDQIIVLVMSRHGTIETHQRECNFKTLCKFNLTISKDMMPESTVVVYHVKDIKSIHQGEVKITTRELSENTLDIDLPSTAKTKEIVNIDIKTKPESKVYLLGYDKRLTYLFQGNEIEKSEVINELASYDKNNKIHVFHMNKTNWHECDVDELKRINKGRKLIIDHGGDDFSANDEEDLDENDGELESVPNDEKEQTSSADDIREDFREVWLFDNFDVLDGEVKKRYKTPDSITSWMISSFSMNEHYGLAIGPRKELAVKNEFFIKVILPNAIRFKEKLRVDVMIYNYVEDEEEIDVEVIMSDAENKKSFVFYDTGCSKTSSDNYKPKKFVKVPYKNTRKVSFYIQTIDNKKAYERFLKIRIDATAKTKHEQSYTDKVFKKLKVEQIGVKTYDIETKDYNLKNSTQRESIVKNVTGNGNEYAKFIINIAGDFLTDDMSNVQLGYELYPHHCLEQRTSRLKGNVEQFRYLKSKFSNTGTDHFSSYYQSILDQKAGKWNYVSTSGYRAYFIEAIASAMEINALPVNKQLIEREFDALKAHQLPDGSFSNFGDTPDSRSEYFRTAYILIPFLKFKKFVTKNYDDVINKGFEYLTHIHNVANTDREAYSVAAFAHALNGNKDLANNLLTEVEKDFKRIDKHHKCYRISKNKTDCNQRHTSYALLAYLQNDRYNDAKTVINYINKEYKLHLSYGYLRTYAIVAEAISKFLIAKPLYKKTDFKVTLTNEGNFKRVVHVTPANQKDSVEVVFPDYTLKPTIEISGSGYCSITKITQSTIELGRTSSIFKLKVTPLNQAQTTSLERTVQICATYLPPEDSNSKEVLFNVIYDVEMPSGYIYKEIANINSKPEIKLAVPRFGSSRLQIYYNDFERNKEYCVDVKATKFFDVKDPQNAGVMVYDYDSKDNVAVEFYKFQNNC